MDKRFILTVSELNTHIKNLLLSDEILTSVYLRGEISNYKLHTSGHIYMTLKDDTGVIRAVMFRAAASKLKFRPDNGMKIIAHGRVDVFVRDRFRLTHEDMHSKSRSRAVVLPRQIAMYICHTYTRASMEAIGVHFGGRDHSTVKHACEKIGAIIGGDPSIQRIVDDFLKQSQQQSAQASTVS